MLRALLICILVFASNTLKAQNFQKVYSAVGSDRGHAIITTSDGGYAIAGLTNSFGAGSADLFLIKTNSSGSIIWQRTFGGSGEEDGMSVALAETPDNGFVLTGGTYSFGASSGDFYVIKVDGSGTLIWSNKYSTNGGIESGRGIKIASNGDILIAGTDNETSFGVADGVLMRLDSGGTRLWSKVYGGGNNDHLHSIEELPGGNLIINGSTQSYGPGGTGGYVIKTDPSGNVLWDYSYGGNANDGFNASAITNNNEIVLTGTTNSYGAGNYDVIVTKIDTNGVVLWTKIYGGSNFERGASIKTIPNSTDYFIVANSESFGNGQKELLVIRIDSNGNIIWSKTFGTSLNEAFDLWAHNTMTPTSDGGFAMTGWSDSLSVGGSSDEILLIKSDGFGASLCEDVIVSVVSPNITRNNPTSGVANTGNYITVSTIQGNSSFTEGTLTYCSVTSPPIADFVTPSTTICANDCVNFSDLSIGVNINSYNWSFPGATPDNSTQQNPTNICYLTPGNYDVRLIVSNSSGIDTLTISNYIIVTPSNTPTFDPIPAICQNGVSPLLSTTSTNSITGTWIPATINTSTVGTQTYTFTPNAGQCANSVLLDITIIEEILPTFNPIAAVCPNDIVVLPTTSTNGQTGTWTPPVNTSASGTINYTFTPTSVTCPLEAVIPITVNSSETPTFNPIPSICVGSAAPILPPISTNGISGTWSGTVSTATPGTFDFTFTPDPPVCNNLAQISVTINPLPFVDAGNYISVCRDAAAITLVGSPVGGTFNGTGVTGNSFSPAFGTQTVTYSYTDGNGCINSDNELITIFDLPNVSGGNDITICDGESVTLSGSGAFTYDWTNGVVNGQTFTPGVGQITYTVTGIDINGCINMNNVSVIVVDAPTANLIPDVTSGLPLLTVNFVNNSSITTTYNWNYGNGIIETTTNLNPTSSTYENPGTYIVILAATNGVCTDYDTVQIIVLQFPEPIINIPNVFSPNNDGLNDYFFLDTENTASIQYIIVNRWGNLIFEDEGTNPFWDGTSKGKPVHEGVYFYKYEVRGINGELYAGHGNVTLIRD